MKKTIISLGLETLYFSGAHRLMRPLAGGVGAILALHHVCPPRAELFQPNRLLEITPPFLEGLIRELRQSHYDLISLDEMHERFLSGHFGRRFVCLTIDDGYSDVLRWAYPMLKAHQVPFALYIASSFQDQTGELWWTALEAVIAKNERVRLVIDGRERSFECATVEQKRQTYDALYWWLRDLPTEQQMREVVRGLCARYGVELASFCRGQCMSWDDLRGLAADPLVTIGAHTVNHYRLKKLEAENTVRAEMEMSRSAIEAKLGMRPCHFAYPVGDATSAGPREFRIAAELGFKTAVTTRPGVLFKVHRDHLFALPRFSINGEHKHYRRLKVLMSGGPTALRNRFHRVDAA